MPTLNEATPTVEISGIDSAIEKANGLSDDSEISKEKLDWLKSIGAQKFEHPMTWDDGKDLYSNEYLAKTPLEVLKARHIE